MSRLTKQMRKEGKTMVGDRKVIGLIVEDLFADYTREVIHSVYHAFPPGRDFRLVVMAGRYDDDSYEDENRHAFRYISNSVYRLGELCEMDGLIFSLGSLNYRDENYLQRALVEKFRNIPKVFIGTKITGQISVCYDNEVGIREAVDFLVNVSGATRICMLGGRDDNVDAVARREIFVRCLRENGIQLPPRAYVSTNMSENCVEEARKLLRDNPDAEAVFCVNDATAKALYRAMEMINRVPGRDIKVFGFDNTHMAGELVPSLASVGAKEMMVGRRAVELLLDQMNGENVKSELIPTMLFGRHSLEIDAYDYDVIDMWHTTEEGISRMFDECFYRYRNERHDREDVNLRRLFYEFITRIFGAMEKRYMSQEEFEEIGLLEDIFIDNGAMEYTDIRKLMKSIERLQERINLLESISPAAAAMINRLLTRLKNKIIYALSYQKEQEARRIFIEQMHLQEFLSLNTDYTGKGAPALSEIVERFGMMMLEDAALYFYDQPLYWHGKNGAKFPETIRLHCVVKDGELYIPSEERQVSPVREMFVRDDLSSKCSSYVVVPVFYGTFLYGYFTCQLSDDTLDRCELIADQLGRVIHEQECRQSGTTAGA